MNVLTVTDVELRISFAQGLLVHSDKHLLIAKTKADPLSTFSNIKNLVSSWEGDEFSRTKAERGVITQAEGKSVDELPVSSMGSELQAQTSQRIDELKGIKETFADLSKKVSDLTLAKEEESAYKQRHESRDMFRGRRKDRLDTQAHRLNEEYDVSRSRDYDTGRQKGLGRQVSNRYHYNRNPGVDRYTYQSDRGPSYIRECDRIEYRGRDNQREPQRLNQLYF